MKVYFHEIKDLELSYAFDETTPWVMEVVGSFDERMDGIQRPPNWKPRSRPTEVSYTLRRVDDLIHVNGKIKTQLNLLCSLCADGFSFPIHTSFHVLLTQSEVYADIPRETSHKGSFDFDTDDRGFELEEDDLDDDLDEGPPLNMNASDFEVTVVKEPLVDLKDLLHEQIALMIPMQPKPDKNEKDDCSKCGRSQVALLSETHEPLKKNPFAVLKDFNRDVKKKSE